MSQRKVKKSNLYTRIYDLQLREWTLGKVESTAKNVNKNMGKAVLNPEEGRRRAGGSLGFVITVWTSGPAWGPAPSCDPGPAEESWPHVVLSQAELQRVLCEPPVAWRTLVACTCQGRASLVQGSLELPPQSSGTQRTHSLCVFPAHTPGWEASLWGCRSAEVLATRLLLLLQLWPSYYTSLWVNLCSWSDRTGPYSHGCGLTPLTCPVHSKEVKQL